MKPNWTTDRPFELLPIFYERVWGRDNLAPWFSLSPGYGRIGEVWFTSEENPTSLGINLGEIIASRPEILGNAADPDRPGICPLLMKLLFTSERLSVQVHPDDAYARRHHQCLGKTEAWYVVDAQEEAEVAAGFRESITPLRLKETAQSGEIEGLLDWRPVNSGDIIFVPAGTVHAIGRDLTICEIQENSDITYRLYDYGRGRELHLEHALAVSRLGPFETKQERVMLADWREQFVQCSYFRIERLRPASLLKMPGGQPFYALLICIKGSARLSGEQVRAGQSWLVPAQSRPFEIDGGGSEWILAYTAEEAMQGITA